MLFQKRCQPIVPYVICIARMTNQGWSGPAFKIDISRRYNKYKLCISSRRREKIKKNKQCICFDLF